MEPGTVLDGGKYRIVGPLGSGGMGAVYEALNTRTRKRVAIKCLLPSLALTSPEATERLMREAEASCRVRHPNVVDVYDIVRDGSLVFLVMEYLEGESLTALLDRGNVPLYRMILLLLPAMRAVAAAHAQGVVHRDIKPDNIFLSRQADVADPVPKVLDFGISKLEARGTARVSLTHSGAVIGTPMYMSYEQLLGADDIDGRADVYAIGVVLYEALTGRPPYEARTHAEWLLRFALPPRPPKQIRQEIPDSLDRLVMWCLACDRAARVPSMEALIRKLEPFASAHTFGNLLTVASQAGAVRSRLQPTPAEAVAAVLRLPGVASGHADKSNAGASNSATAETELTRRTPLSERDSMVLQSRKRSRMLAAISCSALLLATAAYFVLGTGHERAARVTRVQAATHDSSLRLLPPSAADSQPSTEPARPGAVLQPSAAAELNLEADAAQLPEGRVEPPARAAPTAQASHPAATHAPAAPAGPSLKRVITAPSEQRPTKYGPDWGIY